MPSFFSGGTLLCHTPEHSAGPVNVHVCNSKNKWSEQGAKFTYDDLLVDQLNKKLSNVQVKSGAPGRGKWQCGVEFRITLCHMLGNIRLPDVGPKFGMTSLIEGSDVSFASERGFN